MQGLKRRVLAAPLLRAQGQGLAEYGLIIATVALVAVVGLLVLGPAIYSLLPDISVSV
jgi:hypothetical protein